MGELALESSKLMGDDLFCLGGYTDGCTGHLPTAEKFDEGGYEEYWSMLVYYVYHGRGVPASGGGTLPGGSCVSSSGAILS